MRAIILRFSFLFLLLACSGIFFESCSHKTYCPGTASTGNSAALKGSGRKKTHCPGTGSTGNFKPKVNKKAWKQEGVTSKKMEKLMQRKQIQK